MGNRATIGLTTNQGASPVFVYLHWHGDAEWIVEAVTAAAFVMRRNDAGYAIAHLIGEMHNRIDGGGLSLGVLEASDNNRNDDDNGHFTIDTDAGTITQERMEDDDTWSGAIIAEGLEFGSF
jgi:hypothetical protein